MFSTPIYITLDIIRSKLEQDPDLKWRTRISVDNLMELIDFVLTPTYFTSKVDIYQQVKGAAVGSSLSQI